MKIPKVSVAFSSTNLVLCISYIFVAFSEVASLQNCALQYPCSNCNWHWVLNPQDCSQFYLCFGGIAYPRKCPQGTIFSMSWKTCTSRDMAAYEQCYRQKTTISWILNDHPSAKTTKKATTRATTTITTTTTTTTPTPPPRK